MTVPDWIDPETWMPRDWEQTGTECATCGCLRYRHGGVTPKAPCLYGGLHPDIDCKAYAPPVMELGL